MSWFYQSEAQDLDSLGKRWSSFQVEMRKQVAMRVPGHPQPRTLRWGRPQMWSAISTAMWNAEKELGPWPCPILGVVSYVD